MTEAKRQQDGDAARTPKIAMFGEGGMDHHAPRKPRPPIAAGLFGVAPRAGGGKRRDNDPAGVPGVGEA